MEVKVEEKNWGNRRKVKENQSKDTKGGIIRIQQEIRKKGRKMKWDRDKTMINENEKEHEKDGDSL